VAIREYVCACMCVYVYVQGKRTSNRRLGQLGRSKRNQFG